MAALLRKLGELRSTTIGILIEAAVYAAMLALVLMFFTGNGQFIYEAF